MIKVLVVQNDELSDVAYFGQVLQGAGVELTVLHVYLGETIERVQAATFDALIVLGGRGRCFDDTSYPHLPLAIDLLRLFHDTEKAIFAICLGAQLLARALGTQSREAHGWELGFTPLQLSESAKGDPLFGALTQPCELYQFHHDSFYLPPHSTLLMSSDTCSNQAFRVGARSYAVQFHPEVTRQTVARWSAAIPQIDPTADSEFIGKISSASDSQLAAQREVCKSLALNWLRLIEDHKNALST